MINLSILKAPARILAFLVALVFVAGCGNDKDKTGSSAANGDNGMNDDSSRQDTRHFIVGVGPVWRNYPTTTQESISDMMSHLTELGDMVLAQTNWRDDISTSGMVPGYIEDLLNVWPSLFGGYTQHVSHGINFYNQQTRIPDLNTDIDSTNSWANLDAGEKYREVALSLCRDYSAKYLALALEVNVYSLAAGTRSDYDTFVTYYKTVYDEIKILYPDTKVFVTFQLEHMKGLGASSWGYPVDEHWDILDAYDGKLDLVAFTSYPEFEYDSPEDIPDDYYSGITENLPGNLKNRPLAFVEIGWSSRTSEQSQVVFLQRFLELTKSSDIEYVNWVFMHDESADPVNKKLNIGLKTYDGNHPKLIWAEWKALKSKTYQPWFLR